MSIKKPKIKKIVLQVYYGFDEDNDLIIDEDEIRNEFEVKLKEVLKEDKRYEE